MVIGGRIKPQIKQRAGSKCVEFRSCWNCNPAHEHLKKADYPIYCFVCGHYYYKGKDITIMDEATAKKDKELRDKATNVMNHFKKVRKEKNWNETTKNNQ